MKIIWFCLNPYRNVISTWSSGTGAAGLFGALTYASLLAIGMTAEMTMMLMLVVPMLQAFAFFVLLRPPTRNRVPRSSNSSVASTASIVNDPTYYSSFDAPNPGHLLDAQHNQPLLGFRNRIRYIPKLLKYIMPLFFVYLCEYFINMGLVCSCTYFVFIIAMNFMQSILADIRQRPPPFPHLCIMYPSIFF